MNSQSLIKLQSIYWSTTDRTAPLVIQKLFLDSLICKFPHTNRPPKYGSTDWKWQIAKNNVYISIITGSIFDMKTHKNIEKWQSLWLLQGNFDHFQHGLDGKSFNSTNFRCIKSCKLKNWIAEYGAAIELTHLSPVLRFIWKPVICFAEQKRWKKQQYILHNKLSRVASNN